MLLINYSMRMTLEKLTLNYVYGIEEKNVYTNF